MVCHRCHGRRVSSCSPVLSFPAMPQVHSPEHLQPNWEKCVCGKSGLPIRAAENHLPRWIILRSLQYCRMLKKLLKISGWVNYFNFEESLLKRKNPQVETLLMLPVGCWFLNVAFKNPSTTATFWKRKRFTMFQFRSWSQTVTDSNQSQSSW